MGKEDTIFIRSGNPCDPNDDLMLEMEFVCSRENHEKKAPPEECTLGIKLFNRIDFNFYGLKEIEEFQRTLNIIIERGKKRLAEQEGERNG